MKPETPIDDDPERPATARRRLVGFAVHLAVYFIVMLVVVPLNLWMRPEDVWFVLPLVGWGAVLAVHVAYVMGLLDVFRAD